MTFDDLIGRVGRIEARLDALPAGPPRPEKTYRVEVKDRGGEMWPVLTGMGPLAAQSAVLQLWAGGTVARMVEE